MRLGVVDPLLVALVRGGIVELLLDDLVEAVALLHLHPVRRGERVTWVERPELHELARVDVERAEDGGASVDHHVTAHPDRVAPGAHDVARAAHRRRQPAEALLPLVAPDLEVDVDDVVVAGRETGDAVVDDERPLREAVRGEPPDDTHAAAEILDAERARRSAGRELGRRPRLERPAVLRDPDLVDPLAVPQRTARKPYVNEPENATVIASSTATEPLGRTVAWTSLETSS